MIRSDMVLEVRRRVGEDTADFWTDAEIIRALDQAVMKWSHEADWSYQQTFVSTAYVTNDSTVALPADIDVNRITATRIIPTGLTGQPLKRVTVPDGFRLLNEFTTTGTPEWYFIYTTAAAAGVLTATAKLVPAANAGGAIEFLYYRRPAALTADAQEVDLPEDYQEAIVAYATARLWTHELDRSEVKAGEQMGIYNDVLQRALADEHRLGDDEQLAYGKEDEEAYKAGTEGPFRLPAGYGWPTSWFD